VSAPKGIRRKGRSSVFLKRGAANFIRRPIEPEAPLRVMEGFSQILLEDDGFEFPQQLQGYLKTIQEEARRTAALIEDLVASNEQSGQPLSRSQRR
jgi:signal transduction histidine kinase